MEIGDKRTPRDGFIVYESRRQFPGVLDLAKVKQVKVSLDRLEQIPRRDNNASKQELPRLSVRTEEEEERINS